jgi:hypothetical protein
MSATSNEIILRRNTEADEALKKYHNSGSMPSAMRNSLFTRKLLTYIIGLMNLTLMERLYPATFWKTRTAPE